MSRETTRLGIDEAGRGCVLGPLVFGAVLTTASGEEALRHLGVRDSKELSPRRREDLRAAIPALALAVDTLAIPAVRLDEESLHHLGTIAILELARRHRPGVLVLDAPVPPAGIPTWVQRLRRGLRDVGIESVEIVAENRADAVHPVVSAASIVAKTARDAALLDCAREVGVDLGSGYPGDERTRAFLRERWRRDGRFPAFVRTKWETVRRIQDEHRQGWLL
jgi:ribonuclease HII